MRPPDHERSATFPGTVVDWRVRCREGLRHRPFTLMLVDDETIGAEYHRLGLIVSLAVEVRPVDADHVRLVVSGWGMADNPIRAVFRNGPKRGVDRAWAQVIADM